MHAKSLTWSGVHKMFPRRQNWLRATQAAQILWKWSGFRLRTLYPPKPSALGIPQRSRHGVSIRAPDLPILGSPMHDHLFLATREYRPRMWFSNRGLLGWKCDCLIVLSSKRPTSSVRLVLLLFSPLHIVSLGKRVDREFESLFLQVCLICKTFPSQRWVFWMFAYM